MDLNVLIQEISKILCQTTNDIETLIKEIAQKQNISEEWIFSQIYHDLKIENISSSQYINKVVIPGYLGFEHKIFDYFKKKIDEEDDHLMNPFEVEEGVIQCSKCKSYKVFSISKQTRASDEPLTVFSQCSICKKKWIV